MRSVVVLTTFIMVSTAPAAAIELYADELQLGEEERIMMHDMSFLDKETSRKESASKASSKDSASDESEGRSINASFGDLAAPLPSQQVENHAGLREARPKSAADFTLNELQLGEEERIMMLDMKFLDKERNREASASESKDDDSMVASSENISTESNSVEESYKIGQKQGDERVIIPKHGADSDLNELQLGEEERIMMLDMNFLDKERNRKASASESRGDDSMLADSRGISMASILVDKSYKVGHKRDGLTGEQETRPKNAADSSLNELQLGEEERIMMLDMNFLEQEMGRKVVANEVAGGKLTPGSIRENSNGSSLRGVVHVKTESNKLEDGVVEQQREKGARQMKAKLLRGS